MFRGLTAAHVDVKGRIPIPARFRSMFKELANGAVVVTIDTEAPCLLIYPAPYWQEIEAKLAQLPTLHPATRRIQRLLIGHATDLELDTSGRVLLPQLLRQYAHLENSALLVGQGKKIEIWDETTWDANRQEWITAQANDNSGEQLPPELLTLNF